MTLLTLAIAILFIAILATMFQRRFWITVALAVLAGMLYISSAGSGMPVRLFALFPGEHKVIMGKRHGDRMLFVVDFHGVPLLVTMPAGKKAGRRGRKAIARWFAQTHGKKGVRAWMSFSQGRMRFRIRQTPMPRKHR